MMLHHLDDDVKAATAAEIHRVLRPGGTLNIVDLGGPMTATMDSWLDACSAARTSGSLGDAIPRLLRSVGFDSSVVASRRHRFVGRLTFYRATRPV